MTAAKIRFITLAFLFLLKYSASLSSSRNIPSEEWSNLQKTSKEAYQVVGQHHDVDKLDFERDTSWDTNNGSIFIASSTSKQDRSLDFENNATLDLKHDTSSDFKHSETSDFQHDASSDSKHDASSDSKHDASSNFKHDVSSDLRHDTSSQRRSMPGEENKQNIPKEHPRLLNYTELSKLSSFENDLSIAADTSENVKFSDSSIDGIPYSERNPLRNIPVDQIDVLAKTSLNLLDNARQSGVLKTVISALGDRGSSLLGSPANGSSIVPMLLQNLPKYANRSRTVRKTINALNNSKSLSLDAMAEESSFLGRLFLSIDVLRDTNPDLFLEEVFHMLDDVSDSVSNVLASELTNKCLNDLNYTISSFFLREDWAVRMLDSYGKPERGILNGHVRWIGDYDECINVYAPRSPNLSSGNFRGQYCNVEIPIAADLPSFPLWYGVCLPSSCDSVNLVQELLNFLNQSDILSLAEGHLQFSQARILCQPLTTELPFGSYVAISVYLSFGLLAAIGALTTMYYRNQETRNAIVNGDIERSINDGTQNGYGTLDSKLKKKSKNEGWSMKNVLSCFCALSNADKIFSVSDLSGEMVFFHGMRFFALSWVIVGHVYSFNGTVVGNIVEAMHLGDTLLFQFVMNAFYSVDVFFLLSGFLQSYMLLQKFDSNRFRYWPFYIQYVFHRTIRMLPSYLFLMSFYMYVSPYIGYGPMRSQERFDLCAEKWWHNLLFFNNFDKGGQQCMIWTWYVANEMQYSLTSPFLLYAIWRWPKLGFSLAGVVLSTSIGYNFYFTYAYDLIASASSEIETMLGSFPAFYTKFLNYYDYLYMNPVARVNAYLVGILLGTYLYKKKNVVASKTLLVIGWVGSLSVGLILVFGFYRVPMSTLAAAFHNAVDKFLFACCIGWIVFTCKIGKAGFVNKMLSWKCLIPLSRVSYPFYLIHAELMNLYFFSSTAPFQFTYWNVIVLVCAFHVIGYLAAFLISIFLEAPFIKLEKILMTKVAKRH